MMMMMIMMMMMFPLFICNFEQFPSTHVKRHRKRCKGSKVKTIPVRAYYRPRGFKEAEAARFGDNRHMNVVTLAGLCTGLLYHQEKFLIFFSVES
jgi:hypothetical protein